jgi:hypothetical protein
MSALIPMAALGIAGAYLYTRNKKKEQEKQAQAEVTRVLAQQQAQRVRARRLAQAQPLILPEDGPTHEVFQTRTVFGAGMERSNGPTYIAPDPNTGEPILYGSYWR